MTIIEPTLTARDLPTIAYAAFVVFGGLYLTYSIPLLWEYYSRQWEWGKRKRM